MQIWTDDEILLDNGVFYLNKHASNKFYEIYSKYLDDSYSNCLFELEWAKKVVKNYPPKNIRNLTENDETCMVTTDYKKKFKDEKVEVFQLFEYIYSLSSLLNRSIGIDEMKKYGYLLNEDFKFVDYSFEVYYDLKNSDLLSTINTVSDWYELLNILNIANMCNYVDYKFKVEYIDDWLLKNNYYDNDKISALKKFFSVLKEKKNVYYLSEEILNYFNERYDFNSAFRYSVSFSEQRKILDNYNADENFVLLIPKILKIDIKNFDSISKYLIFLKRKLGLSYSTEKISFFEKVLCSDEPLDIMDLINNSNNIDELLNSLSLPIKYSLDVKELNISVLDEWFNANNYYNENIIELRNNFFDIIESNPRDFCFGNNILNYFKYKFENTFKNKILNTQECEVYLIEKHYEPMTEAKKKLFVYSVLSGTGIIASLYLTIILKYDPIKVTMNCTSTFSKFFNTNNKYSYLSEKLGNLFYHFGDISTTMLETK